VTTLPLWVLAAAFLSPFLPGRWRPLRLLAFAVAYLALQALALTAAAALWVAAGLGRRLAAPAFRHWHYRLLGVLLAAVMHAARRAFHLRMVLDADPTPDARPEVPHDDPRPLVVLSRHAGPGDSFLLVHELLNVYGRRPRIVLTNRLQWDPGIDVLLHRVPTRFIAPGRGGVVASIGALAHDMGPDDAVVIFPEGANVTSARRARAVERLEAAGLPGYADRARGFKHLMAPRPAGALAAVAAAPGADVVFVAHTGLEQLSTVRDLWRGLPMDSDVRARLWTVAAEDVPDGDAARVDWLYDWWERLDAWVDANAR
jgi:1-acyl-sn-glycerol-3-phosphate acyltransferase